MTERGDIESVLSTCVQAMYADHRGDSEKDWQRALSEELSRDRSLDVRREVHLGGPGAQLGELNRNWRVFGQGRVVDFMIDEVPVEVKLLKGGLPNWSMTSLLQQGLIWGAAKGKCVLVAVPDEDPSLQEDEMSFLDWLSTRGVQTLIVGDGEFRGPSTRKPRARTPRAIDDRQRAALADELQEVAAKAPTTTWRDLRSAIGKRLENRGWQSGPAPAGHVLFAPPQRNGFFRQGGSLLSVQTTIVHQNDAGAADGKFQAGMALSGLVDATIVIALDQKDRTPDGDVEHARVSELEPLVTNLSQSCRDLGIEWRLVPDSSRSGPVLRWPSV